MKGKRESNLALNKFLHEIGVPSELHTDGAVFQDGRINTGQCQ